MSNIHDPGATSLPAAGAAQPEGLDGADPVRVLMAELDRSHAENAELRGALNDRRRELDAILSSTSWRITQPLRTLVRRLRATLRGGGSANGSGDGAAISAQVYGEWARSFSSLSSAARMLLRSRTESFESKPLISVVMPSYNIAPEYLGAAIESVRRQIYPHWELCISDDASTLAGVRECIEAHAAQDPRIRAVYLGENRNICVNSNSALELATGDYLAFLDADDLLSEDALFWVARTIAAHPEVDLIYSDEDKVDNSGQHFDPHFKTAWNPALMLSQNAFSHLGVFRRRLVEKVGRFREGYEGAQDYDLLLRCASATTTDRIRHIPRVLYHWRVLPHSTAQGLEAKPYAWSAGRRAIEDHLRRQGVKARVGPTHGIYYQVAYEGPVPAPLVSIIMPSTLEKPATLTCLQSVLGKTSYRPFELIILGTDAHLAAARANTALAKLMADPRVATRSHDSKPFNYSHVNNIGAKAAKGNLLCFLNDDIEVIDGNWLDELVSRTCLQGVGAAGPMLYYPSDLIQHAGVLLGVGGIADHAFRNMKRSEAGYFARAVLEQDYSCLTAACMVVQRRAFEDAGGFDTAFPAAFNDVDLCIRMRRNGWRLVWTPTARLYHHESLTFGDDQSPQRKDQYSRDVELMRSRWQDILGCDPYYNPNLRLDSTRQFQLAFPPRLPYPPSFVPKAPAQSESRTAALL